LSRSCNDVGSAARLCWLLQGEKLACPLMTESTEDTEENCRGLIYQALSLKNLSVGFDESNPYDGTKISIAPPVFTRAVVRTSREIARNLRVIVRTSREIARNLRVIVRNSREIARTSRAIVRNLRVIVRTSRAIVRNSREIARNLREIVRTSRVIVRNSREIGFRVS
jgi:methyl-accepting chemotaxis protein